MASCLNCGGGFSPQRSHAKFCSDNCRVAYHRTVKRNNKKSQAQTVPLELVPTCQQWQSEGLHDVLEGILFIYFLDHNVDLAIEVSNTAWKAYQAGLKRN